MELRELVRDLYGIDQPQGCTEEEISTVREIFGALPTVVEEFWRTFGRMPQLNYVQDNWIFPADFQKWKHLAEDGDLLLLNENQSVYLAYIRREDLILPNPPVYLRRGKDGPWELSAPTTNEFLEAALLYEGVWQLKYNPEEFYELSAEDMAMVQAKLEKRSAVLRNWFVTETTFYSNRPDNLVVIMDMGDGGYQAIYGGATEESYAALLEVMEGLGEPI